MSKSLTIPRLVVGGAGHGRALDDAWIPVVHAALDAGLVAIDTAPLYGFGAAERLLGRALRGRRAQVKLLGKVGLRWDGDHGDVLFEAPIDGRTRAVRKDGRPATLRRDLDESLARLGVERLDVVQIHHPDRHVPIAESIGALLELRGEGKLDAIGVSNFDDAQLDAALAACPELVSDQLPLSLLEQRARPAIAHAHARGVGVLAYAPLGRGVLAGHGLGAPLGADDPRRWAAEFSAENLARIAVPMRQVLLPIAARHDASPGQVAMAWALAQPGVDALVVGLRTRAQLDEALGVTAVTLTAAERDALATAFAGLQLSDGVHFGLRDRWRARVGRWRARLRG